ncbi:RagB/SusD family nutrient uptake outer membrane protein [Algoriphagus pacificus]|uniref:RagB/SusD family nutrient uptake outer membrane protein n=1 Tax=Algoriphagus pacificus TaxID=2811234 RepID=A0ABS3CFB1_9BACT|nr:RagB/SusD family nutrient uptake outer membrane protein [Algoriphagus pacificus]MBN7815201.1 RagB/SusD family nutrient uptake outer membrane protein [Algoriphagus pacificus]
MKINLYKILAVWLLLSISGCADLNEKPIGVFAPETFFKSPKDVETAVLGAYGVIASENLFGRQFICALQFRGDMVDIGNRATSAERIQVNDFNMDSNNGMVGRFWPQWFQAINAANSAEAGGISLGLPDEEINHLIAEAKFVRAFAYYHLVRMFGDLPYINFAVTDPSSLKTVSKTPEAEIYAGIIADLEFAKQWLPNTQKNNIRTRPTAGTAAAYLASVHLTLGQYQEAYTEAKFVIDNKALFGYELETDYEDNFKASIANSLKETIFAFDFLGQQAVGGNNDDSLVPMIEVLNLTGGYGVSVPNMNVYDDWDSRDYRKKVSFIDTLVVDGVKRPYSEFSTPRPHIGKWARDFGNGNAIGRYSDHNFSDFRYAEVLLIAAEALGEINGPTAEAAGYLNQVRARARNWAGTQTNFPEDVNPTMSKAEFIDLVLEDRRLELAFEWKRWYDIKRRDLGVKVFTGPNSLEPHPNFDPSRDYLMPLPASELRINPNLAPNNPGY